MAISMLADEHQAGRYPLWPGASPDWLIADDWEPWPVLSIGGGELFIVAIFAVRAGALTRLLEGSKAAGLRPVIVCPLGRAMPAILKRWGWEMTNPKDEDGGRLEEWRPPSGWRDYP